MEIGVVELSERCDHPVGTHAITLSKIEGERPRRARVCSETLIYLGMGGDDDVVLQKGGYIHIVLSNTNKHIKLIKK
jgi:hypothetical protein